jgi:hypothetical protein
VSKIGFEKELGVKRNSAVGGREATRAKNGDAIGSGKKDAERQASDATCDYA